VTASMPSIDDLWVRLKSLQGRAFETKTGKPFTYEISGDVFYPSRTTYNISKAEFRKALALAPLDGPGAIATPFEDQPTCGLSCTTNVFGGRIARPLEQQQRCASRQRSVLLVLVADRPASVRSSQAFVIDFQCLSRCAINSARCRSSPPSRMLMSSGSARQ